MTPPYNIYKMTPPYNTYKMTHNPQFCSVQRKFSFLTKFSINPAYSYLYRRVKLLITQNTGGVFDTVCE